MCSYLSRVCRPAHICLSLCGVGGKRKRLRYVLNNALTSDKTAVNDCLIWDKAPSSIPF